MADQNLDVCAHLVRIAHRFVAQEQTRYYIGGVRIEPSPEGGVVIVATDGHTLIAFHDEGGRTSRPVTIRLSKSVRRSWKARSRANVRLRMSLGSEPADIPAEIVRVFDAGHEDVKALAPNAELGGTYPDWRRVVPGADGSPICENAPAALGGHLLSRFARAAVDLGWLIDPLVAGRFITLHQAGKEAPTFVRFASGQPAFGAIMPIREKSTIVEVPAWGRTKASQAEAAS